MIPETNATALVAGLLWSAIPVGLAVLGFFIVKVYYAPRSYGEWKRFFSDTKGRAKLRERKRRLDAIRNRRPGSILPGIPTSERDFALEPLIRRRKFKQAKAYIMEQMHQHRHSASTRGRMNIYIQYLELIEGTIR